MKPALSVPIEDTRLFASPSQIDEYFINLAKLINGIPASLVCNLDEMGFSEYVDTRPQTIVVPRSVKEDKILVPISRAKRRMTILWCIFADGTFINPLVVLSRKSIEKELFDAGFTPENFLFRYQSSGFVTTELFNEWAAKILIPEIISRKNKILQIDPTFEKSAVITMDGLKQHFSEYFEDECWNAGIEISQIPPHSSDQVQALDLCIFAIAKASIPKFRPDKDYNIQTIEVIKLISACQSVSTTFNIKKSFQRAGISTSYNNPFLITTVDINHCDRVRHFEQREVTTNPDSKNRISIIQDDYHVDLNGISINTEDESTELRVPDLAIENPPPNYVPTLLDLLAELEPDLLKEISIPVPEEVHELAVSIINENPPPTSPAEYTSEEMPTSPAEYTSEEMPTGLTEYAPVEIPSSYLPNEFPPDELQDTQEFHFIQASSSIQQFADSSYYTDEINVRMNHLFIPYGY